MRYTKCIKEIKLFVEGQEVNYYNQIPLPSSLDYSFGINNEIASIKDMRNKEKVVVFGKRQYDKETSYLVPVTLYCEKGESDNITFVGEIGAWGTVCEVIINSGPTATIEVT